MKKFSTVLIASLFLLFFSCSARIEGAIMQGGAADLSFEASLEPRTVALIRSLRAFMGDAQDAPVLDAEAIGRSIAAAPGVRSVSIKNTGASSLDGNISISNVADFLSSPSTKGRFITYTEGYAPGTSSIIIVLDRETTPELVSRLSPEAAEYLEALLAPAILGETSTRQEYLSLVSLIYGRPLADEISASRIRAAIEFPRPLTSIRGGGASGRRAEFDIPLVDLLVLENPLRYEVTW